MTQYDRNTMETYLDEILSMTGIPRRHLIFSLLHVQHAP